MENIGILDPKGENKNPLTNNSYSDTYIKLAQKWKNFPAYSNAKKIIKDIQDNQIILITSGTGSGKTVLLPKFCLHALNYKGKIAITLPKQIIAKSAAEFSALTLDVELGNQVGYQYKGSDKKFKSENNNLLYATDGTIVARLLNDPLLKDFDAVIIDEAHERKVQIDFLIYLLKQVIKKRPEFKIIIMSATVNVDIFKKYFGKYKFKHIDVGSKTNYLIESIFLKKNLNNRDYIEKGFEIINKIIKEDDVTKEGAHDILFFVTSVAETIKVCELLNDKKYVNELCVEVYSGIDKDKQNIVQDKDLYKKDGKNRKIVIGTNVAESSLTIDGIKFVIDSGLELSSSYNYVLDCHTLNKQLITQAQVKQRMGRAGRTEEGVCYHLYTKDTLEEMKKFPEPDIKTSDLHEEFIKLLNIDTINNTDNLKLILKDFIEKPSKEYIESGIDKLKKLNLVKNKQLTSFGIMIAEMGISPMDGLTIYAAHHLNCIREVIIILSMIYSCKGNMVELFNLPFDLVDKNDTNKLKYLNKKFDDARKIFNNKYGDHISLLKIYKTYLIKKENDTKLNEWMYKYFLKKNIFLKTKTNYQRLMKIYRKYFNNLGKKEIKNLMEYDTVYRILTCFLFGFKINTATVKNNKISTKKIKNVKTNNYSFIKLTKKINYLIYYELFQSDNININILSYIPKKSLELLNIFIK